MGTHETGNGITACKVKFVDMQFRLWNVNPSEEAVSLRKCQCFEWKLFVSKFNASANGMESLCEAFRLCDLNISINISTISLSVASNLLNVRTRVRFVFSSDDQMTCETGILRCVYDFDDIKFDVDIRVSVVSLPKWGWLWWRNENEHASNSRQNCNSNFQRKARQYNSPFHVETTTQFC